MSMKDENKDADGEKIPQSMQGHLIGVSRYVPKYVYRDERMGGRFGESWPQFVTPDFFVSPVESCQAQPTYDDTQSGLATASRSSGNVVTTNRDWVIGRGQDKIPTPIRHWLFMFIAVVQQGWRNISIPQRHRLRQEGPCWHGIQSYSTCVGPYRHMTDKDSVCQRMLF
ncbi:hypothetical protein An08g07130 [Aspergillus niger]|uniref:Uncharacterized protein n=2 Tax=Aspergillus niger TaxID=5061 RepID=A2QRT2_ASPNC|nr:hypothetical protein An08g07130 [Aspergillus niger]CAK39960.1 hypothetical protein An08g07130 [Aspergillus niger]